MKKIITLILSIVLTVNVLGAVCVNEVKASNNTKKVQLSTKEAIVYTGQTKSIKLKNIKKKVKWKVKNKKVAKIVSKKGKYQNKVVIKGIKKGTTKLVATYKGKNYKVTISVKQKKAGVIISPETTTPKPTVPEPTVPEPTVPEPTVPETTTGLKDPFENKNIVVTVKNDIIRLDDTLVISFEMQDYIEGQKMAWSEPPVKVEKLENGQWVRVSCILGFIEPMYYSEGNYGEISVHLRSHFEISVGHYRWTHQVNWTDVSVEFDIVPDIDMDVSMDAEGIYVALTNNINKGISIGYIFNKFEKYVDGEWVNGLPEGSSSKTEEILGNISPGESLEFTMLIGNMTEEYSAVGNSNIYEMNKPVSHSCIFLSKPLESGHYRYTHEIWVDGEAPRYVSKEFDYVKEE